MMSEAQKLPILEFDNPPIVEKLMGVQFQRLEDWSVPHFGLFWQEIRSDFPDFSDRPPLLSEGGNYNFEDPLIRCWFFHKSENKLIQLQQDRFLYNWQKPTDYKEYPHYKTIRPDFENAWRKFIKFLSANQVGTPTIEQCEITYVDHFERGREWQSLADLPDVISCWSGLSGSTLHSEPDLVTLQMSYSMPKINGKLIIHLQPGFRDEDSKEIFQLRITVVGKPESQKVEDVLAWFDLGRD
jgi:uncharacterized protein (TIGR04255 family)